MKSRLIHHECFSGGPEAAQFEILAEMVNDAACTAVVAVAVAATAAAALACANATAAAAAAATAGVVARTRSRALHGVLVLWGERK